MHLSNTDVERIAHLARIAVEETEIAPLAASLGDILGFVDQLEQADCANVAPMAHPLDALQRLRDDVVSETDRREAFQSIAPKVEAGLYLVPKVLE